MSTNNSDMNIKCRRQGLSEEQRESEMQRARINQRRAREEDHERKGAKDRDRWQNASEQCCKAERARDRLRKKTKYERATTRNRVSEG